MKENEKGIRGEERRGEAGRTLIVCYIFDIIPSDSETARHLRSPSSSLLLPSFFPLSSLFLLSFFLEKIKIDIRDHHKINLKNAKDIHNEVQKLYAKYEPFQVGEREEKERRGRGERGKGRGRGEGRGERGEVIFLPLF